MRAPDLLCQHTALAELPRDGTQREMTAGADIGDFRSKVGSVSVRVGRDGLAQCRATLPCPPEARRPVGITEFDPARLGQGEGLFFAPGNGLAFGWGDECHDAEGKIVGFRQTDGKKPRAAIAQCQKEGRVLSWAD